MRLLLVPSTYPHDAAEWFGAQNERCVLALRGNVEHLEVLTPRPFAPGLLAFNSRWKAYTEIPRRHVRNGVQIHRPAYPVLPGVLRGFWQSRLSFVFARSLATALHRCARFDAILSFDLATTGGLAWRLGSDLGIPACGWAIGSDIRARAGSRIGRSVREALRRLDLVFYQSHELKTLGAGLLGIRPEDLPSDRHVVQSRGVMAPEIVPGGDVRRSVRRTLGLADDQVVVLHLGRIVRGKGLFELVDGFAHWAKKRSDLVLLLVGAIPGHDDTPALERRIQGLSEVRERIKILPACAHGRIWEFFSAAEIFAFPSFREGMPNSLLEAMLSGLPAVAFAIPAVHEIARFGNGLLTVPPHDFGHFGNAVLALAADPPLRQQIGERAQVMVRQHFSIHSNMRVVVERVQSRLASVSR